MKITSVDWFRMSMIASAVSVCYLLPRLIQEHLWIHLIAAIIAILAITVAMRLRSEVDKTRDRAWCESVLTHTGKSETATAIIRQVYEQGCSSIKASIEHEQ